MGFQNKTKNQSNYNNKIILFKDRIKWTTCKYLLKNDLPVEATEPSLLWTMQFARTKFVYPNDMCLNQPRMISPVARWRQCATDRPNSTSVKSIINISKIIWIKFVSSFIVHVIVSAIVIHEVTIANNYKLHSFGSISVIKVAV